MISIDLSSQTIKSVLCLGAHSDDIEIGCSGLVMRLLRTFADIHVRWVVFAASATRRSEALSSAELVLADVQHKEIVVEQFRNGYFPFHGAEIKDCFEEMKTEVNPDLILTHYREDRHQDHRCISDLTWNTFRDHFILEYEVPKYDGDLGRPNHYVPLPGELVEKKLALLESGFPSQQSRPWFSRDVFSGLMRLRGVECNADSGYAEAYFARKVVW